MREYVESPASLSNNARAFWPLQGDRRDQAPIWMSLDTGSTDFFPGSNTLVCIVCGTRSAELEAMTDAQVKAALLPTLQTVYGPLPAVVNFYMPRWLSDPLFRGSYSNK